VTASQDPSETTKDVLATASLVDASFPKPDWGMLVAWDSMIGHLPQADAVESVRMFYSTVVDRRIMPADVLRLSRQIRDTRLSAAGTSRLDDLNTADPADPRAWLAERRRLAGLIGDGVIPAGNPVRADVEVRPVGDLLSVVGRRWGVAAVSAVELADERARSDARDAAAAAVAHAKAGRRVSE
jgi:hypothetical protein